MNHDDYLIPGPDVFQQYIQAMMDACGEDVVCGYSHSADGCPVAGWVSDLYQSDNVAVDLDSMYVDEDEFDTPAWVFHVVRAVDGYMDDQGEKPVTGQQMMEILNGLRASMEDLPHE